MRTQAIAVSYGPNEPLFVCRHELAMHRADFAAAVDINHRAIQAVAAAVGGPLDDSEIDRNAAFGGCFANAVEVAVLNRDGLTDIVCVQGLLQTGLEFRTVSAFNPKWIAGHQRFAEGDEFATLSSRPINLFDDLRERCVALQPDWRNLRQSDL